MKFCVAFHAEGITDVIIYGSPDDPKIKNRGFAFVDFDCHRSASNARRRISIGRVVMWGLQIICDWAEPLDLDPSEEVMSKVKVLYVRNLKSEVTEDELRSLFERFGVLERIKKVKSYAFVHFVERESAIEAMNNLHKTVSRRLFPESGRTVDHRICLQLVFDVE